MAKYTLQLSEEDAERLRQSMRAITRLRQRHEAILRELKEAQDYANVTWRAVVAEACIYDSLPSGVAPTFVYGEQNPSVHLNHQGLATWESSFTGGRGPRQCTKNGSTTNSLRVPTGYQG